MIKFNLVTVRAGHQLVEVIDGDRVVAVIYPDEEEAPSIRIVSAHFDGFSSTIRSLTKAVVVDETQPLPVVIMKFTRS